MGRLPVVECLIAILNRREQCRDHIRGEEDIECLDGLDSVDTVASGKVPLSAWYVPGTYVEMVWRAESEAFESR